MSWFLKHKDELSLADRLADRITEFCGSWMFLFIHILWFLLWIASRIEPFPFGLLTMIVSLEAIMLSTFIMISQNRNSERDRTHAEHDYEVNRQAKLEIEALMDKLDSLEEKKLNHIILLLTSTK